MLNTLQPEICITDMLMITAEAVLKIAQKSGLNPKLSDIYNTDTLEGLAFIGGLLRQCAEKASKTKIEILPR